MLDQSIIEVVSVYGGDGERSGVRHHHQKEQGPEQSLHEPIASLLEQVRRIGSLRALHRTSVLLGFATVATTSTQTCVFHLLEERHGA